MFLGACFKRGFCCGINPCSSSNTHAGCAEPSASPRVSCTLHRAWASSPHGHSPLAFKDRTCLQSHAPLPVFSEGQQITPVLGCALRADDAFIPPRTGAGSRKEREEVALAKGRISAGLEGSLWSQPLPSWSLPPLLWSLRLQPAPSCPPLASDLQWGWRFRE